MATTRPSSLIVCTALRKAWCCPRAGGLQIRLLSCRLLGPLLDRKFHVGGQVAGSPAPFYLTRQQADRSHQQQGGSSFSWLRVLRKIVAHGPPLYFLQLPSLVVALLSWLHLCGCIPSYKMVTGWGARNNYSPFSWFKRPQPPAMVLPCTPASPQEGSRPRRLHKAK